MTPVGGGGANGSGLSVSPLTVGHGHGTMAGRSRAGGALVGGIADCANAAVASTHAFEIRARSVTAAAFFLIG